jgi:hypothetical protein
MSWSSRRNLRTVSLPALFLAFASATSIASAQEQSEPDPIAMLLASSEVFRSASSLSVIVDVSYDIVQPNGQKYEFAETRQFFVKQPNRLRIDVTPREDNPVSVYFDGDKINLYTASENVYAEIEYTGSIDGVIEVLTETLGVPIPMQDFVSRVQIVDVIDAIVDATFVGYAMIDEMEYQHFAFRAEETDFQVWITTEAPHLVKRIVIDYREEPGQPQFRGEISSLDLGAKLADDLFEFEAPADAELISIQSRLEE